MDKKNPKNVSNDDGHVIFIDRLVDYHIQKDKKKESIKEEKKDKKTPKR